MADREKRQRKHVQRLGNYADDEAVSCCRPPPAARCRWPSNAAAAYRPALTAATAAHSQLGELDLESESEDEGSDVEEARGAVAKAARRGGGGRRGAPPKTAVTADMLSTLLAGAPALVDYLLLEDSVRRWAHDQMGARGRDEWSTCGCARIRQQPVEALPHLLHPGLQPCSITLCCRDVVNLNIAAGGGVNLEPVWQALASRIKWVLGGVRTNTCLVQLAGAV